MERSADKDNLQALIVLVYGSIVVMLISRKPGHLTAVPLAHSFVCVSPSLNPTAFLVADGHAGNHVKVENAGAMTHMRVRSEGAATEKSSAAAGCKHQDGERSLEMIISLSHLKMGPKRTPPAIAKWPRI